MGERPLSVESQEDGLPALAGGVITGWEDTYMYTKIIKYMCMNEDSRSKTYNVLLHCPF